MEEGRGAGGRRRATRRKKRKEERGRTRRRRRRRADIWMSLSSGPLAPLGNELRKKKKNNTASVGGPVSSLIDFINSTNEEARGKWNRGAGGGSFSD